MGKNYPTNSLFEKISDNVLEVKKQVWEDDNIPYPITCRIRYVINEDKYYVFFYSTGDYGNNCDTYTTEKAAFDEFEYRLLKYTKKNTINYNLRKSIKLSNIS